MKTEDANKILQGDWESRSCDECPCLLGNSAGTRPHATVAGEVSILCGACAYDYDRHEFGQTGVMSGSDLPMKALLRRDLDTYRPFFDTEVALSPTFSALWEKYKVHPTLNDPRLKKAILVDLTTCEVYSRDFAEDFNTALAGKVTKGSAVVEIFDAMCGYVGLELYRFGREDCMWIQGQVREKGAQAWYRSCHADRAFVDAMNAATRQHVGLPVGYTIYEYGVRLPSGLFGTINLFGEELATAPARAWQHAEDNVRAYLSTSYQIPELQPQWVTGSGFWPRRVKEQS